jgi:hypothetical protein
MSASGSLTPDVWTTILESTYREVIRRERITNLPGECDCHKIKLVRKDGSSS